MPLTIELARSAPADVAASAVGVVAGQTEGAGIDWALPRRARASRRRRATCARCPATAAPPPTWWASARPAEVDANVLRFAAGRAGPRRQAAPVAGGRPPRRAADGTSRGRRRPGHRRGPGARRLPVLRPSSPSRSPSELARAVIVGGGGKRAEDAIARGLTLAEAVCWARDLENEPGGSLTPTELAKRAAAVGQAAPASRSRCGTRRRSASRSSAACSA